MRNFKINFHVFFSIDETIQDCKVFSVLITMLTIKALKQWSAHTYHYKFALH